MKTLTFSRSAAKALRAIPKKDAQALIAKLTAYADGEPQDVSMLKGSSYRRLRHGNWRAVFEETATEVSVLAVANRREAYR